jgi:hypothetical protein
MKGLFPALRVFAPGWEWAFCRLVVGRIFASEDSVAGSFIARGIGLDDAEG